MITKNIVKKCYYNYNDNLISIVYYLNDRLHNNNGPSIIYYHSNGNVKEKNHFINDYGHNIKGPGIIKYNAFNIILYKAYWFNHKTLSNINSNKELKRYIKLQNIK